MATTYLADSTVSAKLTKTGAAKAAADGKPGVVAPTGEGGKTAGVSKNLNLPITVGKVFFIDDKGSHRDDHSLAPAELVDHRADTEHDDRRQR